MNQGAKNDQELRIAVRQVSGTHLGHPNVDEIVDAICKIAIANGADPEIRQGAWRGLAEDISNGVRPNV